MCGDPGLPRAVLYSQRSSPEQPRSDVSGSERCSKRSRNNSTLAERKGISESELASPFLIFHRPECRRFLSE